MTVREALDRAAELRPGCKLSDETRRRWLCEEDAMLRKLLVPVPYDTLYPHFLCARIDAALGETDRYAGEQAQYNSILSGLAAGLRQENLPRRRVRWRW